MTRDTATTSETRNGTSRPAVEIPRTNRGTVARLVTIFGSLGPNGQKGVHYIFDVGDAGYREIILAGDDPLDSIAPQAPAAAWSERELHDQYGVKLEGQPDARPLVLHDNWPDGCFPMLGELGEVPWSHREYRFL
jgi:Ni,Fe-hydrogenase III component G